MEDVFDTLGYIYEQKSCNYSNIAIICNEDLAEDILKHICTISNMYDLGININYINFDKDDYAGAYGIVLYIEDSEIYLSVETAQSNNGYKMFDMDYVYVSSDVDKDFIRKQIAYEGELDVFTITHDCED
jgi:hypothetical protein